MNGARQVALQVLSRVAQDGAYTSQALTATLNRAKLSPRDTALATELVYGTLRHQASLDASLNRHLTQPIQKLPPPIQWILRLGAYQLFETRIAAHGAVGETVNLVARRFGHLRGVVNAVLRKLAGTVAAKRTPLERGQDAFSALEPWLQRQLNALLPGDEPSALAATFTDEAPITVRVNLLRATPEALCARLKASGVHAERMPAPFTAMLRLLRPGKIAELSGFAEGLFTVQDPAAYLAALLASPEEGDVVLDLCAAPGGKTTHLAEQMRNQGHVLAVEHHPGRAGLVASGQTRLGLNCIEVFCEDATQDAVLAEALGTLGREEADVVLLDAPCTGLGTLRRHPELRSTSYEKVLSLAALQASLLTAAARRVRPGGRLLYVVCTFTQEEGELQMAQFLAEHSDFFAEDIPTDLAAFAAGPFVRTWTHLHQIDSFFFARLRRRTLSA